jgi:hypothetical protein
MTLQLIFDDTYAVPPDLKALVGVERFGSLVFQRRSRLEAMRTIAADAGASMIHLQKGEDRESLIATLREENPDRLSLFCPSHLIPVGTSDAVVTFLRQVQYAPCGMHIPLPEARDRRGWILMRGALLREYLLKQQEGKVTDFFESHGHTLVDVPGRLRLIDVSDARTLLDFLSGQFDVRLFNAIEHDAYTVTKRSNNRTKLKREFDFYRLVPPAFQMFMVQPFDYADDGQTASYKMERLSFPDMALQWVHRAFQPHEFERFLEHIFHFVKIRPEKRVGKAELSAVQTDLYVDKVEERIESFKKLPQYKELAPLLERAFGGIDALLARYLKLYERMHKSFQSTALVIGHGDLCFSNILYSKTNQYLKLIDPRGAEHEDDLYTDPYYDLAKLSHSILGSYDFINNDKFDVLVDEKLVLQLSLEGGPPPWAAPMFVNRLQAAGFRPDLIRLCEASLFISMLPLHVDRPRKVLGFAINASLILEGVAKDREI